MDGKIGLRTTRGAWTSVTTTIGRLSLPALAGIALLAAGCGAASSASTGASTHPALRTGPAKSHPANSGVAPSVVMRSLFFYPTAIHAKVGQTVTWTNEDSSPHNVTYVSGPQFRSSPRLEPGAKFSIKVTAPGTIHYFCTIHPWMKATIIVSP